MKRYTHNQIKDVINIAKKKCTEYDALQLEEFKKLLEDGWIIYDTQPIVNTDNMKIITLVKG